jgi:predicted peptidase
VTKDLDLWKKALVNTPIWAFHGENDNVVPASGTVDMIESIQALGSKVAKMTIIKGGKHNIAGSCYRNAELFDWFLSHQRE